MAVTNSSKLEYLQKYMDVNKSKQGKTLKKKKKLKKNGNIKIIDNSISFTNVNTNYEDIGEFDLQEEKPIMYAEDGSTITTKDIEEERMKTSRWKPLNVNNADINNKNTNTNKSRENLPIQKRSSFDLVSQRHDSSDSDMSPLRQPRDRHDTSDSDQSPLRRNPHIDSDQDLSPARKKRLKSGDDLSPHRDHKATNIINKRKELLPEVLNTGKSGLRTGVELREENQLKRKHELEAMKNLDANISGKGAQTVHRDRKSGQKINLKLEAIKKRKDEEEKLEHDEKYAKWGKGVAQGDLYQQRLKDDLHEMEKPLARYKDDKDLDVLLRERDRAGDPMLAFITKAKDKQKRPGKPQYSGPTPPPNRFNILPGYRYDGVDRSNGFEKRRFLEINKRKTYKDAAYKWSVEEM